MDWENVTAFAVLLGPDAEPELVRNTIRLIPGVDTVSAQTDTGVAALERQLAEATAREQGLREAGNDLDALATDLARMLTKAIAKTGTVTELRAIQERGDAAMSRWGAATAPAQEGSDATDARRGQGRREPTAD